MDRIVKTTVHKPEYKWQSGSMYECLLLPVGEDRKYAYKACWSEGEYLRYLILQKIEEGVKLTVKEVELAFDVYGRERYENGQYGY